MALCHNCNRMLSANGSCLYCGTSAGRDSVGPPKPRRANWLRRILAIVLAALLIHFFFISPTGRDMIRPIWEKIGLSKIVAI